MIKISCIIAAYNEEERIGDVLKVVSSHPLINEVIVIDDYSKDNTKKIVSRFPTVKYLIQPKNMGKTAAVKRGLEEARGELIILIDADLIGLTPQNITDLINPVVSGKADVSISLRINAPIGFRLIGLDYISGERVFPKKMLEEKYDDLLKLPGFGLEVFMNRIIIKNSYKIKVVFWPAVKSPLKYKKYGFWGGISGELRMFYDILKTISITEIVYEIFKMLHLRIKN